MNPPPSDPTGQLRLRLLECWLPLAQELRAAEGWADDAHGLQALLLLAAPALALAHSTSEARAILSAYHTLMEQDRR